MTLTESTALPWFEIPLKVSPSFTMGDLAAFTEAAGDLCCYLNFGEIELSEEGAYLDIMGSNDDYDDLMAVIDGTEGVEIDWDAVAEMVEAGE